MTLRKIFPLALLFLVLSAFQMPDKYHRINLGESVSILMPQNFVAMSDDDIAAAFRTNNKPLAVYRSENRQAQVSASTSKFEWASDDIEMIKGFYKGAIANSSYDKVKFLNEGEIIKVGSKQGVLFEFIGVMPSDPNAIVNRGGKSTYHQMLYSVYNGKVLVVNFSMRAKDYQYWQKDARKIVSSVKI